MMGYFIVGIQSHIHNFGTFTLEGSVSNLFIFATETMIEHSEFASKR